MRLFQAGRAAGGQTVVHVHVVPRHKGDPSPTSWHSQTATDRDLDEILSRIR
jgi:diadenosine tetraphosphate (Ap4A) HIT family hydrolase